MKNLLFALVGVLLLSFWSCEKKPSNIFLSSVTVDVFPEQGYNPDIYIVVRQNGGRIGASDIKANASRFDKHTFDMNLVLLNAEQDVTIELWEDLGSGNKIGECTRSWSGFEDLQGVSCQNNGFAYTANFEYTY